MTCLDCSNVEATLHRQALAEVALDQAKPLPRIKMK